MTIKVAVIYYSSTGTVHALAQAVTEGAASAGDGPDAAALDAARYQGRRLAQITIRLLAGSRVSRADGNGRGTLSGGTCDDRTIHECPHPQPHESEDRSHLDGPSAGLYQPVHGDPGRVHR